ncbi:PREDICTED: probable bifunctional TENA-E protein [Nicotiana attenuata]|uniref:Bifunctional tena-e protein n=1 Tax=Nicotiana attenuata TaxID=49451 RepID=A0A314L8S3_NICAT|nr:PREDICTED: probable bifunctional TENA-E protein [Nicotiana attenuata]OIT38016.1 putative bifunctional tena-e protein [Nicotiana attenuata]
MEKKNEALTVEKLTQIEKWLRKHKLQYTTATRHPFINSIHDASIDFSSFKIWLGREYVFVKTALAPFAASVLLKAWKESEYSSDVEVMLAELTYLNDKISWLKEEAPKWHISLTSVVVDHNPILDYFRFFERLTSSDEKYTEAVTILWAVESVYHYGFAHCLKEGNSTPEEMKAACKKWANESFKQHCQSLETIANNRLEQASEEVVSKSEVLFLELLENVVGFWNMNLG